MADGLARAGFDLDLLDGKAAEGAFAYVLMRARVEVKRDEIARRTHRVFIEYQQRSKTDGRWRPSGIEVTTADYWALEVNKDVWVVVPTERLRKVMLEVWEARQDLRKPGGDHNNYLGACVPVEDILWSVVGDNDD